MARLQTNKDRYTMTYLRQVSGNPDGVFISEAFEKRMEVLLPSFALLNKAFSFFYVFDFARMRYLYVSDSIKEIMGYGVNDWVNGGVDFVFTTVYKEDVLRLKEIHSSLFEHYYALSIEERLDLKYSFELRVVRSDGNVIWLLQQGSFIEIDGEGKPVVTFDILSNVSAYKKDKTMTLTMAKHDGTKKLISYFPINGKTKFSHREIELIRLIAEGFSSKQIGERLFISSHTVDTHRRNMLKKSSVRNSTELVIYARENGLI